MSSKKKRKRPADSAGSGGAGSGASGSGSAPPEAAAPGPAADSPASLYLRRRARRPRRRGVTLFTAVAFVIFLALVIAYPVIGPGLYMNDVTTGVTPEYPRLQPRALDLAPEAAFEAALRTARGRDRWTLTALDTATLTFGAEVRTRLLGFVDDVTVSVTAARDGSGSLVHMRSRSRAGRGDFGTNARRVEAFLRGL